MIKNAFYAGRCGRLENLDPTDFVVRGQAQSVYDLYRKMVLGSVDAADYVRPVTFDEKPDIDSPDLTNSLGLTLEEVHQAQNNAESTARAEIDELLKKRESKKQEEERKQLEAAKAEENKEKT